MAITINSTANNVKVTQPTDQKVTITNNNTGAIVNVTPTDGRIVTVSALGPTGLRGLQGPPSPPGALSGSLFLTGSLSVSSSFVDLTNATAISGSIFSGSFRGDGSGLNPFTHITASGNISASGFISASSVHIAASGPSSLTIDSGIYDNAVNIYSTDERVNVSLSDSNTEVI